MSTLWERRQLIAAGRCPQCGVAVKKAGECADCFADRFPNDDLSSRSMVSGYFIARSKFKDDMGYGACESGAEENDDGDD